METMLVIDSPFINQNYFLLSLVLQPLPDIECKKLKKSETQRLSSIEQTNDLFMASNLATSRRLTECSDIKLDG